MLILNIKIIGSDELSIFIAIYDYIDEKRNSNPNIFSTIKSFFYDPMSKNMSLIRKRICFFKKCNQYKITRIPFFFFYAFIFENNLHD